MRISTLKNPEVECLVTKVTHKFAPAKAEFLLNEFWDCSFPGFLQYSNIVTYVELETPESQRFVAEIFPSELNQYLVPKYIYEGKLALYQKCVMENKFKQRRFKTTCPQRFGQHQVQVIEELPLEPEQFPDS